MFRNIKKLIINKNFVIFGSLLFILLAVVETKQFLERHSIEKEIQGLQQQSDELSKKNSDLQSSIAYFQTNDYKQKIARTQLNLRKDGETVYSFSTQNPTMLGSAYNSDSTSSNEISDPHKWWNYFFNP